MYTSRVTSGQVAGVLDISPDTLHAMDRYDNSNNSSSNITLHYMILHYSDSLRSEIQYSWVSGSPAEYAAYFSIEQRTGVVRQVRPVDREQVEEFVMEVRARERTEAGREAVARLEIRVEAKDIQPPELRVSAAEGSVQENSGPGTLVLDTRGQPITFSVSDRDLSLVSDNNWHEEPATKNCN